MISDPLRSTLPAPKRAPVGRVAILPAPPSVNEAYRNSTKAEIAKGYRGRRKTKTYTDWRRAAGLILNAARLGQFTAPVQVLIRVGKCSQARDLDNFSKAACDLLVHCGVIRSDNMTCVHDVRIIRAFDDVPAGMVAVSVEYVRREAA